MVKMMPKDDAIVIAEAREIVELLPVEAQSDKELVKAIIGSLQSGIDRHEVQIQAQNIAHQRLEAKVDRGFILVNHELEKERIHRGHLEKTVDRLHGTLDKTTEYVQKIATQVVQAEAKAEGAKELAKNSRWANFDPLSGMLLSALGIISIMALFTFSQKPTYVQPAPVPQSNKSIIRCGEDVNCTFVGPPPTQPVRQVPNNGGV
jgi:hypothetical protein